MILPAFVAVLVQVRLKASSCVVDAHFRSPQRPAVQPCTLRAAARTLLADYCCILRRHARRAFFDFARLCICVVDAETYRFDCLSSRCFRAVQDCTYASLTLAETNSDTFGHEPRQSCNKREEPLCYGEYIKKKLDESFVIYALQASDVVRGDVETALQEHRGHALAERSSSVRQRRLVFEYRQVCLALFVVATWQ